MNDFEQKVPLRNWGVKNQFGPKWFPESPAPGTLTLCTPAVSWTRRLGLLCPPSLINNINGHPLHSLTHIFPILVFPWTSHEIFSHILFKLIPQKIPKHKPNVMLPESFHFMQLPYGSICENAIQQGLVLEWYWIGSLNCFDTFSNNA